MIQDDLIGILKNKFPDFDWPFSESYGMLTIEAPASKIVEVLRFLKEDSRCGYTFLTDLCGIHMPGDPDFEFGVIYHLHNLPENKRLRVKANIKGSLPEIDSATSVWSGANWMERETFDFFGILFRGHPNLRRILNVDDMDYFPMRKQYPLEDATREDKEDSFFGR